MRLYEGLLAAKDDAWFARFSHGGEKQAAAEAMEQQILSPSFFRGYVLVLNDAVWKLLTNVPEKPVPLMRGQFRSAEILHNMNLGCMKTDHTFELYEGVRDALTQVDTDDFQKERHQVSWVYDCLRLIPGLYGYLEEADFVRLCAVSPRWHGDAAALADMVLENYRTGVRKEDGGYRSLDKDEPVFRKLLDTIHEQLPVSIPSYKACMDLIVYGYPTDSDAYRKLAGKLIRAGLADQRNVEQVLAYVHLMLQNGNRYEDFQKGELYIISPRVMSDCWLDTRGFLFNGAVPHLDRSVFIGKTEE